MKIKYLLYDNTGWFGIQITKILRNNRIMYHIGTSSTDINLINKEIDIITPFSLKNGTYNKNLFY